MGGQTFQREEKKHEEETPYLDQDSPIGSPAGTPSNVPGVFVLLFIFRKVFLLFLWQLCQQFGG